MTDGRTGPNTDLDVAEAEAEAARLMRELPSRCATAPGARDDT